MALRSALLALAAGTGALLAVGIAVTELAAPAIEFSLFVGIPAGLVAGLVTAALVVLGLQSDVRSTRHRAALAAGWAGVAFLAVLAAGIGVGLRPSVALTAAGVAGALGGALATLPGARGPPADAE